jgi:hypothetical protein
MTSWHFTGEAWTEHAELSGGREEEGVRQASIEVSKGDTRLLPRGPEMSILMSTYLEKQGKYICRTIILEIQDPGTRKLF